MKKITPILVWLLFILTILYPLGVLGASCFGYRFEPTSFSAFAVAIATLSIGIVVNDCIFKNKLETKGLRILSVLILPFSLINAAFYIIACSKIWIAACVLISVGCCCYLTVKYSKPPALKKTAIILSALMILPLGYMSFISLIFGDIGHNTVVQTVESPSGEYYAKVIDSDQGALAGNTFVDVYEKSKINTIIFKIEKKPQRVYTGDWDEFDNMQIYWRDDEHLIINSTEYNIK